MRATTLSLLALLLLACAHAPPPPPLSRDRERESLERAASWPHPTPAVVLQLTNAYLATHQEQAGYTFFQAQAQAHPDDMLALALAGLFQARLAGTIGLLSRVSWVEDAAAKLDRAGSAPGLPRYLRGVVFAQLPERFGRAKQAVEDLEWTRANADKFPPGVQRGVWRGLAAAYATLGRTDDAAKAAALVGPDLLADGSVSARDGFRFGPKRILEPAPGVTVATGYDFGDIGFVTTRGGLVAIDAGTRAVNAAAALAAVRARTGDLPIVAVIVTHAHWDHIGGLSAFVGPGTQVIAQAGFAGELAKVKSAATPFQDFFGSAAEHRYQLEPTHLVAHDETLEIGGRRFELYPAHGGETDDALLVGIPDDGVLFVGDAFMPFFGAPFAAEGNVDGIFDTIATISRIGPRLLVHGHAPLTANFPIATIEPLGAALAVLRDSTRKGLAQARTLPQILDENVLPEVLAAHPDAVVPFLLMRDGLVKRLYAEETGYWKADGEGMEVVTAAEWARAVDLLARSEDAFVDAATNLEARGDLALSARIADLGLAAYPKSERLSAARRRALEGLRARTQFNPFKLIVYSELAGEEVPPPPAR